MNSYFGKFLAAYNNALAPSFQKLRLSTYVTRQSRSIPQAELLDALADNPHIRKLRDIANRWSPIDPLSPARRSVLAKYREANQQMFRFSALVRAPTKEALDNISQYAVNSNPKVGHVVPITLMDLKKAQLLHALSQEKRHPLLILTSNIYGSLFFLVLESADPAHLKLFHRAQRWSKVNQQNIKVGQRLLVAIQEAIEYSSIRPGFSKT